MRRPLPPTKTDTVGQRDRFVVCLRKAREKPYFNVAARLVVPPFIFLCSVSFAVAEENSANAFSTPADAQLTTVYEQALKRLSPKNQEILRRSERAWIVYTEKQEAFVETLQHENLLSDDAVDRSEVNEVELRTGFLQEFYTVGKPLPSAAKSVVQSQESFMQKDYDLCMGRLGTGEQRLLREAERAWIAYRDASADAVKAAYKTEGAVNLAWLRLAGCHMVQLHFLAMSITSQPVGAPPPPPVAAATPQPLPPNPAPASPTPEELKTLASFREEAQELLRTFLGNKDDPFWKKGDAIKNAPSLSPELTDQVLKLQKTATDLYRKKRLSQVFQNAENESRAIEALANWVHITQELKGDTPESAASHVTYFEAMKPKEVTSEYMPLWETLSSWVTVCAKDVKEFKEHVSQAKLSAAAGHTAEAIKEYEAAYGIIESPAIPGAIKKLRMQSLGL